MSTSKVTHTPRPWTSRECTYYEMRGFIQAGGKDIATTWATNGRENAAHIVRCVNSHDALLTACRAWLDETTTPDEAMRQTREAIKLAEGQG